MSKLDPLIDQHKPGELRWYAKRFSEMAEDHRKQAADLDAKAARYLAKAMKDD